MIFLIAWTLWKIDVRKSLAQPPESVRNQLKSAIKKIEEQEKQFLKRASRIINKNFISIWAREVVEGKVQYKINEEYPTVKDILANASSRLPKNEICIDQINQCFPYDLYFSDAADDKTDFVDIEPNEDQVRSTIVKLIEIFEAQGFSDQIRKKIEETDIHGITSKLIKEVVNN